jgi:preprotein translocase subunit SecE
VARDRKRAKQRRERRRAGSPRTRPGGAGSLAQGDSSAEQAPLTDNLPGALEHASSGVDEFDAALVRGAGGLAATPDTSPPDQDAEDALQADGDAEDALQADGDAEDALQVPGTALERDQDGDAAPIAGLGRPAGRAGGAVAEGVRERPSGAPLPSGNRVVAFLRASWAELQRVQWPDRRQVTQATAVVLGFVAVAGLYLGAADFVAKEIVEFVL